MPASISAQPLTNGPPRCGVLRLNNVVFLSRRCDNREISHLLSGAKGSQIIPKALGSLSRYFPPCQDFTVGFSLRLEIGYHRCFCVTIPLLVGIRSSSSRSSRCLTLFYLPPFAPYVVSLSIVSYKPIAKPASGLSYRHSDLMANRTISCKQDVVHALMSRSQPHRAEFPDAKFHCPLRRGSLLYPLPSA